MLPDYFRAVFLAAGRVPWLQWLALVVANGGLWFLILYATGDARPVTAWALAFLLLLCLVQILVLLGFHRWKLDRSAALALQRELTPELKVLGLRERMLNGMRSFDLVIQNDSAAPLSAHFRLWALLCSGTLLRAGTKPRTCRIISLRSCHSLLWCRR
jgi:hypothetical protein